MISKFFIMKKLTIIVPVFNEINTLHIILDKLINMELFNKIQKEIIIIDDASTDGSKEKILEYEKKYPYLKKDTLV